MATCVEVLSDSYMPPVQIVEARRHPLVGAVLVIALALAMCLLDYAI
jgi:hypothetical protein